jgi:hypothetical protein
MAMLSTSDELLPHLETLNTANAYALAQRTLSWAREPMASEFSSRPGDRAELSHADGLGNRIVPLVVVASVFQATCAARTASSRVLDLGARLVLVFLSADDGDVNGIPEPAPDRQWEIGQFTPSLHRWLAEFGEFLHKVPISARQRFVNAFHGYLRARRREPKPGDRLSVAEHWASRRHTIFSDPFVTHSLISLQIDTRPFDHYLDECLDDIANTAWLANDLGSLGRDLQHENPGAEDQVDPEDLNLVSTYVRELGLTHAAAFDRIVDEYNRIVTRLRARLDDLHREVRSPDADTFIDLVRANVRGNLDAMQALRFRYDNIDRLFERLLLIR